MPTSGPQEHHPPTPTIVSAETPPKINRAAKKNLSLGATLRRCPKRVCPNYPLLEDLGPHLPFSSALRLVFFVLTSKTAQGSIIIVLHQNSTICLEHDVCPNVGCTEQ
ncbi:hypothetical protein ElyMa_001957300 [Elysia marginata]|uniref:Uncharacterized protein n=1 Tax=Elysia marginata TaxID=1093978 RepID=A0AAV4EZA4_9GAST|nr:hypothetical protein ElyMa_001957300 [Elysia marginata]